VAAGEMAARCWQRSAGQVAVLPEVWLGRRATRAGKV
jgi:hypothetical protein